MISCQVVINDKKEARLNIMLKKDKLLSKLDEYVRDLESFEYQLQELRKPFIHQNSSLIRFTARDTYKEYNNP
jgi:hypothetical protein